MFEVFNDKTMSEVNKPIEVGVASEESGGKMKRKRRKKKEVWQLNSDIEKRKSSRLSDDKIKKMLESFDTTSKVTKSAVSGKKMMRTKQRKTKCGQCSKCLNEDCGTCVYCLDKPKFGGPLRLKQKCVERRCNNMSNFY